MYDIYDLPKSIPLGRQGEQYARAVEIDCAKMLNDYPGARLTLMQRRTRGETARIVKADVSDTGVITWSPDMDAMAVAGLGAIEIVATVDDKVAKSVIAATAIAPSLTPPDTDTQSGWVKDVLDASDAAQGAMAAAQSSANAAAGSASAASKSAASAATSADAASGSASAAAQSAAAADTSAKASAESAAAAAGTLDSVKESADAAAGSARAAAESASDAAGSKSSAAQSATDAAGSASAAAGSASQSAAARDAASGSASAAAQSAAAADTSAKASAESAAAAAGTLDSVKESADAAAGSARAAAESASDAAGSKSSAAQSATDAAGSASAAAGSASQSAAARDAAQAAQTAAGAAASDAAGSAAAAAGSKDAAAQSASAAAASAEAAEKAAQDAAGIIDDTVIAEGKAWSSKNTVDKLLPMQTVTGNPVVIEALEGYPLELSASWEPKQEGSGTPSPDNIRPITGTKLVTLRESNANLLNPDDIDTSSIEAYGLTIEPIGESTIRIKGTYNVSGARSFAIVYLNNYLLSGRGLKITSTVTSGTYLSHKLYGLRTQKENVIALQVDAKDWVPGVMVDMTLKIGVYAPEAVPAEYQPYAGKQSLLTLPRTIYGGIIDTITGQGQETWGHIDSYAGETLPGKWISDRDEYAAGATPTIGAQVAYKLATPVPFTATGGQTVLALAGTNAIITDADTLTITAPTPPQTTASTAEAQAAKLDYVAMMADVDVDDLTAVDDADADSGMDMPTGIEGSETDGKQEV